MPMIIQNNNDIITIRILTQPNGVGKQWIKFSFYQTLRKLM